MKPRRVTETRAAQTIESKPNDFVIPTKSCSVSLNSIVGWGRCVHKTNEGIAYLALPVMEFINHVVPIYSLMVAVPMLAKLLSFKYSVF
jgi:hypothetical protein